MGNLFSHDVRPPTPLTPAIAPPPPKPKMQVVGHIEVRGEQVPVRFEKEEEEKHLDKIKTMKALTDWIGRVDKEFILKELLIQSVDMFGPRVGFIKFKASVSDKEGTVIPSIIFMRGAAVGMLIVIEGEDKKLYTVLTVQPRFPTGKYNFADLPAGMLDDSGDFIGVAAKELKEETGIAVTTKDLIDMTKLAFPDEEGVFPSCGGCDERLRFFLYKTKMTTAQITELQGKCTGVLEEGEKIKLKVILLDDLWNAAPDAKALCALSLYENLTKRGKV